MQKQTLPLASGDTQDPAQEINVLHSAIVAHEVDSNSRSNEVMTKKLTIDNLIQEEVD